MNFQVNMKGTALIPAGVDGGEIHDSCGSGKLDAPQKAGFIKLPRAAEIIRAPTTAQIRTHSARAVCARRTPSGGAHGGQGRINPHRVAVPDIHCRAFQWVALLRVQQGDPQLRGHTGPAFRDVRPQFGTVNVIGAFFLFAGERAGGGGRHGPQRRCSEENPGGVQECCCFPCLYIAPAARKSS